MRSLRIILVCCLVLPLFAKGESGRPNVLFLAVDDMNDWVGCLGGYPGTVHTPNIDRLASRGVLFTNAHCAAPKCAPSRAAILTGLRPSTTGLYENNHWWRPNLPDVVTLPMAFSAKGYEVAGCGKIFHHTAGNNPPDQWDEYFRLTFRNDGWFRGVKNNYPWSVPVSEPKGFPFSGVTGMGHENDWGSLPIPEDEYDDSLSVDFTREFLARSHEKPFFLACGIFRPHLPWYVPDSYFSLYSLESIALPECPDEDLDDVPEVGRKLAQDRLSDLRAIKEAGKWKQAVRAYLASISFADAQIGRVFDALDQSSAKDDTVIVFWSDHGWHLGEKQHWHKSTLWEEATRVPFIVAGPGIEPGVCDRPVSLLDIYPTLSDLCHLGTDRDDCDGTSLLPLLEDPRAEWERPAVIEYLQGNAAVRSEDFRYIRYRDGGEELYDHRTDPDEWKNLAEDPWYSDTKQSLSEWLPKNWAKPAKPKGAFQFDVEEYSWMEKESGKKIEGYR